MSHTRTTRTRILIASLALFAATGCGDSSGPGVPDDPGILLVPMGQSGFWPGDLVWTRDGTELIYAEPDLKAVSVSTHMVRQLDASPSITSLARSTAGEWIYFGAFVATQPGPNDPNFRVSRVHPTSGAVEILTTTFPGAYNDVLVSADERFLVAGGGLYDLQTAARIDLPAGRPFGFSPDGTKLLYYLDVTGTSTPSPTLISTADGSSQPLHSTGYFHLAHRWEGNSPQLLRTDSEFISGNNYTVRLSEIDGVTGVTRDIAQFSTTGGYFFNTNWSPDGRTLGTWIEQGSIAERTNRTNLYVIRSGSAPALVASVTPLSGGPPGPPVFSPNGNSVAYFYYYDGPRRSLYMKSGI